MTLPAWLIAFIAVQYAVIGFLFYRHDQPWMAVTYFVTWWEILGSP